MKSIVKWFKDEKGYGFIEYKDNDILIHYCTFREQGKEEIVEFELIKTDNAMNIKTYYKHKKLDNFFLCVKNV